MVVTHRNERGKIAEYGSSVFTRGRWSLRKNTNQTQGTNKPKIQHIGLFRLSRLQGAAYCNLAAQKRPFPRVIARTVFDTD